MSDHEIVIDQDGGVTFRCNAKPVNGVSPPCWLAYDSEFWEEGDERKDYGKCMIEPWIEDVWECTSEDMEDIHIAVEPIWNGQGYELEVVKPPKFVPMGMVDVRWSHTSENGDFQGGGTQVMAYRQEEE